MGELTTEITNDEGDKRWLASDGKECNTNSFETNQNRGG